VAERLRIREIDDDEGRRLVRIVRRGTGSVVTWRRAQMVLLPAQGMDVAAITNVAFTSEDRVRDVIRNANADGFDSLYPRYKGKPQDRPLPGHGTNMPTWGGGPAAGLVAVNAATVKCPRMARSGCSVCAPDTEHVPRSPAPGQGLIHCPFPDRSGQGHQSDRRTSTRRLEPGFEYYAVTSPSAARSRGNRASVYFGE
jgi:hypothetical protein